VNSICVFCGSSVGRDPSYLKAAASAGAALDAGGRVVGVMPRALAEREIAHARLSELHVVETMHERKATMAALADGFLALPGGAGTLDEFFEQWTWAQLGIHGKPCGLLNVKDYFQPLLAMIEKIVAEGFMAQSYRDMLLVEPTVEGLLARFKSYSPPPRKWQAPKP